MLNYTIDDKSIGESVYVTYAGRSEDPGSMWSVRQNSTKDISECSGRYQQKDQHCPYREESGSIINTDLYSENSRYPQEERQRSYREHSEEKRRYDPGLSNFSSMITPVKKLRTTYGSKHCSAVVDFKMRRRNKTVTLQWPPFEGCLAESNISYLTVTQSLCNLPPYPVSFPIYIIYKGKGRVSTLEIDPHLDHSNIRFYLRPDRSACDTQVDDSFTVKGGAVTWIVE